MPIERLDEYLADSSMPFPYSPGPTGEESDEALELEPEVEEHEDGSATYDFSEAVPEAEDIGFYDNIADLIDKGELEKIGSTIKDNLMVDISSRQEWSKTYVNGLKYLGFVKERRTDPWPNACDVTHPLMAEAVVRFQSNAISEIFPADGPTKANIVGVNSEEVVAQSNRVKDYMNFLLTDQMPEYRDEFEKLLFGLPIIGSAFKKVMFDELCGMPVADYISAEDIVVPYGAKNIEKADRVSHVLSISQNDFRKLKLNKFYSDIELSEPAPYTSDIFDVKSQKDKLEGVKNLGTFNGDGNFRFIEMHCNYDIPGFEHRTEDGEPSGLELPYIITVDYENSKVLSVRRNWRENDPLYKKRNHFVHYQYVPGTGFYGYGLTHLVGNISESATSILRQLVDSGTLANVPGGFKTKGLRVDGINDPIAPGQWKDVDVSGGNIRDNFFPLPYKEPSAVLYQLMLGLVEDGRRFASLNDIQASEMNNQAPVGTTLAILERSMKVMSAIHSRLHAAARKEFKLLAEVIAEFGPTEYPYDNGQFTGSLKEDFSSKVDIMPVSDPNASTMAQRIMTHQAAFQNMATAPELYNKKRLHRNFLAAINMKDVDDIIPPDQSIPLQDPVTENVNIIMGNPVKVFETQDHEAHIEAHMAALQDPKLTGLLGQSPNAQSIQGVMEDHLKMHVAYAYRAKIQEQLGFQMPKIEEDMPEDSEIQFSRVVSEAARRLTDQSIAEQEQKKAKEIMEDPNWQLRKEEVAIARQAAEAKALNENIKTKISAMSKMADLDAREKDRAVEMVKVILGAEADKIDITNRAQAAELQSAISILQAVLNSAAKVDQLTITSNKKESNGLS